jgi:hypothetical protein
MMGRGFLATIALVYGEVIRFFLEKEPLPP